MPTAFDHVPRTARGHLRLNFYAAVYRLIRHIRRLNHSGGEDLQRTLDRYPFMVGYLDEMLPYMPDGISWDAGLDWWEAEIAAWEASSGTHLPLASLTRDGDLTFAHRIALLIVGLVEEDSRFGTLFLDLQQPLPHRRPCVELVGHIMEEDGPAAWRSLLAAGLIEIVNRDAPRSEWTPRVPAMLWDIIVGEVEPRAAPWLRVHQPEEFPEPADLILPEEFLGRVRRLPGLLGAAKTRTVVLRGMRGSERLEILGAAAREMEKGVAHVDLSTDHERSTEPSWHLLGPVCTMCRCLPVITYDIGPGETAELPTLTGYHGPLGVIMGLEGGVSGPAAESAVSITLPTLTAEHRLRYWEQALGRHPIDDLAEVSEQFHVPGGYIRQMASMAIAHAALDRRQTVTIPDVREAGRALNRQVLDTLAARLDAAGSWDQLVVSGATALKLFELERRCRHRERLLDHLGPAFGRGGNQGVRALFTGASGTGKTQAAKILAAELGMDLYRVDLGAVVNKYIGETEKNLHRVLSRAEELDVVLLLDEGDSLLSNRTEVKSSNDRYANLETNYLLQRLETYQGIVVVTTNAAQYIDNAFQRRMDVVVNFVPPQAEERRRIWQLHLPARHDVPDAYLDDVAARCALTGGQIRNAALHATLLAVDDRSGVMRRAHVEQAIRSEYRKAGALSPEEANGHAEASFGAMEAFIGMLAQ